MPAQIGSEEFIRLDWPQHSQGEMIREITRPGTNGVAFQAIGKRSRAVRARTVIDLADEATADAKYASYVADLRGSLQTVIDDFGQTHEDVMIIDVQKLNERVCETAVGGINGGKVLLLCDWIFQETKVD